MKVQNIKPTTITWGGAEPLPAIIPISPEGKDVVWSASNFKSTADCHLAIFKRRKDMEAARGTLTPTTAITVGGHTWLIQNVTINEGWRKTPKSRRRIWQAKLNLVRYIAPPTK
jgi:hypothetical protein